MSDVPATAPSSAEAVPVDEEQVHRSAEVVERLERHSEPAGDQAGLSAADRDTADRESENENEGGTRGA